MNLVLFERSEIAQPLPRTDPRARHILDVLRRKAGDSLDVGLLGGLRGRARLTAIGQSALTLEFSWSEASLPPDPVILLVGLPRPQTSRKILRDAPTLGLQAVHFFRSDKGEPSYADSSLWTTGEWRTQLAEGAAQAFDTRLPEVSAGRPLDELLAELAAASARLALDPYEGRELLGNTSLPDIATITSASPAILALGPERGWSPAERDLLRARGFRLATLGKRILRTETACIAAVAGLKTRLGLL